MANEPIVPWTPVTPSGASQTAGGGLIMPGSQAASSPLLQGALPKVVIPKTAPAAGKLKGVSGPPKINGKSNLAKLGDFGYSNLQRLATETDAILQNMGNAGPGLIHWAGGLAADVKGLLWNRLLFDSPYKFKATEDTWHSIGRTGGLVYDFKPGRGWFAREKDYYNAAVQGEPLSNLIIEDAGNAAIIGGAVAKGLRAGGAMAAGAAERAAAGGLEKGVARSLAPGEAVSAEAKAAAPTLSKIAKGAFEAEQTIQKGLLPAHKAMEYTFKPWAYGLGKLGSLVRDGAYFGSLHMGWGAKAANAYMDQIKVLQSEGVPFDAPEIRDLRIKANKALRMSVSWPMRRYAAAMAREADAVSANTAREVINATAAPEHAGKYDPEMKVTHGETLSDVEQQAIIAAINGHAELIDAMTQQFDVPVEQIASLARYNEYPQYSLSPEAAQLAVNFVRNPGALSKMQYERLASAVESVTKTLRTQAQDKISGYGRRAPLDPAQLVPVPLVKYLMEEVSKRPELQPIAEFMQNNKNIWELPVDDPTRVGMLRMIVGALPDEIVYDSSIYPSTMRPLIEMYKRYRRNLERRAIAAGEGESPTNPKSGNLGAAKEYVGRKLRAAEHYKRQIDQISQNIASIEKRHSESVGKLRQMEMYEKIANGADVAEVAAEYGMDAQALQRSFNATRLGRSYRNYKAALANAENLFNEAVAAGVATVENGQIVLTGRTSLTNQLDMALQEAIALRDERNALVEQMVEERKAEMANVEDAADQIDTMTDDMFDAEDDFVAAGGDIADLEVPDTSVQDLKASLGIQEPEFNVGELTAVRDTNLKKIEDLQAEKAQLESAPAPSGGMTKEQYLAALREKVKTGEIAGSVVKQVEKAFDTEYTVSTDKQRGTAADKIAFKASKEVGKYLMVSEANGQLWWTNGYMLGRVADSPLLAERITEPGRYEPVAKNLADTKVAGFRNTGGESPPVGKLIDLDPAAVEAKPIAVNRVISPEYDIVVLRLPDGRTMGVAADWVDALNKPGIKFMVTEPNKPVMFVDGKNVIGVAMPYRDSGVIPTEQGIIAGAQTMFRGASVEGAVADGGPGNEARLAKIDSDIAAAQSIVDETNKQIEQSKLKPVAEISTSSKFIAKTIVDDLGGELIGGRSVSFDGAKFSQKKAIDKGYERPPDSIAQINFSIGEKEAPYIHINIPIYETTSASDIVKAANQLIESIQITKDALTETDTVAISNRPTQNQNGKTSSFVSFYGVKSDAAFEAVRNAMVAAINIRDAALEHVWAAEDARDARLQQATQKVSSRKIIPIDENGVPKLEKVDNGVPKKPESSVQYVVPEPLGYIPEISDPSNIGVSLIENAIPELDRLAEIKKAELETRRSKKPLKSWDEPRVHISIDFGKDGGDIPASITISKNVVSGRISAQWSYFDEHNYRGASGMSQRVHINILDNVIPDENGALPSVGVDSKVLREYLNQARSAWEQIKAEAPTTEVSDSIVTYPHPEDIIEDLYPSGSHNQIRFEFPDPRYLTKDVFAKAADDFDKSLDRFENFIDAIDGKADLSERAVEARRPSEVKPRPSISDPQIRAEVYENDLVRSIDSKLAAKVDEARTGQQKIQSLDKFMQAVKRNTKAWNEYQQAWEKFNLTREKLVAIPERQAKLESKLIDVMAKKVEVEGQAQAVLASPEYQALLKAPATLPLDVALSPERNLLAPEGAVELPSGEQVSPIGPQYVPSATPREFAGGSRTYTAREGLEGYVVSPSERMRSGEREQIFNLIKVAGKVAAEGRRMIMNEQWKLFLAQNGMTLSGMIDQINQRIDRLNKAGYDIPKIDLAAMREDALTRARNMSTEELNAKFAITEPSPGEYVPGVGAEAPGVRSPERNVERMANKLLGADILKIAKDANFVPVDPWSSVDRVVEDVRITEDGMMFVDSATLEAAKRTTSSVDPERREPVLAAFTAVNKFFKSTTLALSMMWQIGDLTTSIILAKMTGVSFETMLARMKQVYEAEYGSVASMFDTSRQPLPTDPYARLALSSGVQDVSLSTWERRTLRGLPDMEKRRLLEKGGYVGQKLQNIADRSFKFNETINRISRHAFFLEQLDRVLQEKGTTLDAVVSDGSWRTDPQIRELVNEAARTANKWLGDFNDLSVFERKYLSLAFPFWGWTKHIHKVFSALGKEHPETLKWYIYMGTLGSNTQEDPFGLRQGAISVFGGAASVNFLNPLADVAEGGIFRLLHGDPRGVGRMFGPAVRLPAALLGIDLANVDQMNIPSGAATYSDTGMKQPGLIDYTDLSTYKNLLGFGLQQFPIVTRLAAIAPVEPGTEIPGTGFALGPVSRYSTGQARRRASGELITQPGGTAAAIGRLFGVPLIPSRSDQQITDVVKSARARLKAVEKAKKKYKAQQQGG